MTIRRCFLLMTSVGAALLPGWRITLSEDPSLTAQGWLQRKVISEVARRLGEAGLDRASAQLFATKVLGGTSEREQFTEAVAAELPR